jgi:hypothetical protein
MMTSFDTAPQASMINRSVGQTTYKEQSRIESQDMFDLIEEKEAQFEQEKLVFEEKLMQQEDEICRLNSENMHVNR